MNLVNSLDILEATTLAANAALTGAFALIMAATATIISAKRLSNVLLSGSVAERKSPDNRMFGRFPVNAALSEPWSDSGRVLITPASADVKRGVFFCFAKNMTLFTVSWMRLLCVLSTSILCCFFYPIPHIFVSIIIIPKIKIIAIWYLPTSFRCFTLKIFNFAYINAQ